MRRRACLVTAAAMLALGTITFQGASAAPPPTPPGLQAFSDPDQGARPMARMWFADATAGQDPDDTIEEQILSLAEVGFGGVEVAMLSDTGAFENDQADIAGWGTQNWVNLLKKVYRAAEKVPGGFEVDLTITAHWPPSINTIDPNDAQASQETSIAFTPLTGEALAASSVELRLPATRVTDNGAGFGGSGAPFIFTDTLVSAAVGQVTAVTPGEGTDAETKYTVDWESLTPVGSQADAGSPAGIPDREYYEAKQDSLGWQGTYDEAVVATFGPEPEEDSTGDKLTEDGLRHRMADVQFNYTADLAGVVDQISEAVEADEATDNIEPGDWVAIGVYSRGTGQNLSGGKAMPMKNRVYVPDYFSRAGLETVTDFWADSILSDVELRGLMSANPGSIFEDSIEANVSTNFWTPDLLDHFAEDYPYRDLMAFVVSDVRVTGGFGSSAGPDVLDFSGGDREAIGRMYEDYNTLLGQLYLDEHLIPATEWADSLGMTFRGQTYDLSGLDIGSAALAADIPEGDNMTKGDGLRRLAAAKNLGDKRYLSMEAITGTSVNRFNWEEVLFELTSNYSWGVNRAVLHGTPYSKALNGGVMCSGFSGCNAADWPGWDPFGATSFGESYTYRQIYWDAETQVTDYLARIQGLMQNSQQKVDIAILQDGREVFENPSGNAFQELLDNGYSYNLVSGGMLEQGNAAIVEDGLIHPAGPGYKAVILDEVEVVSIATAQRLLAYAEAGVPVVLLDTEPAESRVYGSDGGQDEQVRALLTELSAQPVVTKAASETEALAFLRSVGVTGHANYSIPRLETTAYQDGSATYYYIYNNTSTFQGMLSAGSVKSYKDPTSQSYAAPIVAPSVTLQGDGVPYLLDAFTGGLSQAGQYTRNAGGTVTVRLDTLKGGEATIVALISDQVAPTGEPVTTVYGGDDYSIRRDGGGQPELVTRESGTYAAVVGDTARKITTTVGQARQLDDWNLVLDSYGPTHEKASQLLDDDGIQTVDPSETKITSVDLGARELGPWSDIDVGAEILAQLGVASMDEVSGRGHYSTTFDWDGSDDGAVLQVGYGNDQITKVILNGAELALDNLTDELDLGGQLAEGVNELTIELSTTLNKRAAAVKGVDPYSGGLGGNVPRANLRNGLSSVVLVPYSVTALKQEHTPRPQPTATVTVTAKPTPGQDLYDTPGFHESGGRRWMTTCEAYSSQVDRCWTWIWGTTVQQRGGRFMATTGWAFNNLTYVGGTRSQWVGNPLGNAGSWAGTDGRQWRTECDTARTGRGGCRSYVTASVIARVGDSYRWVIKEVFNNQIRFR